MADVHPRVASQYNQRPPKLGPQSLNLKFMDSPQQQILNKQSARKASDPLTRPIATNARVKQDEQLRRDMYLAFVDNALQQKLKGVSDPFDELVGQFNPKSSSNSSPQSTQLRLWLLALSHVVSRLERVHASLVQAIVNMQWTTMDASTVKSYTVFMGMLLSAKPEYLSIVLEKVSQGFTYQAGLQALDTNIPEGSSTPLTRRVVYDRLHYLLKHILSLIPTSPSTLMPLLSKNFPHKRQKLADQSTFIRNVLRISRYCPELSDKILANIIDRAIQIDVEIQVELEELEDEDPEAIEDHEIFELDPFDSVVGQDEPDSDSSDSESEDVGGDDFSDLSSDPDDDGSDNGVEEVPMNVQHIQDMVKKLDTILALIFEHLRDIHASITSGPMTEDTSASSSLNSLPPLPPLTPIITPIASPFIDSFSAPSSRPSSPFPIPPILTSSPSHSSSSTPSKRPKVVIADQRTLRSQFHNLLAIFDRTILRTFKSRYTQFLLFWYTSLDPEFCDTFQGMLVDTVLFQPEVPTVTRAAAASYIGSFVSRASFVERESVRQVVGVLCQFLGSHLDVVDSVITASSNGGGVFDLTELNTAQNTVFYAVTQAVFLIFCFRWRDLLEEEPEYEQVLASKAGKKWIPQLGVIQRVVNCVLNPLKVCSPNVTMQFARVAQATDFVYCYSILKSNQRNSDDTTATTTGATAQRGIHLGGGAVVNAELNTFFPFDPCKLPKVSTYVESVYREWSSVAIDDEEEEDEDEEDEDHEMKEGLDAPRPPPSEGEDDVIGASFEAMSISPYRPVIPPL